MGPSPLAGCLVRYASRMHGALDDGAIGGRHHVASPLGAWLLVAMAAPAAIGPDRDALTEVLGCDVDDAAAAATALLADPHSEVASAVAAWTAPGAAFTDAFRTWQQRLPPQVETGDLPDEAGLDAWVREHTFGLISKAPVQWTPQLYFVLASALATKVSWQVPFLLAPAAELGAASPWSARLGQVLRAPEHGHRALIAVTTDAGDVAVHVAQAQHGLLVYSVAAAPEVPAGVVLAAAHQIATTDAAGAAVERRQLSDLPLGAGPAWLLREETSAAGGDTCTVVLPAWSARSQLDLRKPGLGFDLVAAALVPEAARWEARQAAMARYTRTGFEAAAVTMFAAFESARLPARRRVADLRFGHPFAVVAVAVDGPPEWQGLPVFSAWVADPEDAADDDSGRSTQRSL
jgi:hypothetical protein